MWTMIETGLALNPTTPIGTNLSSTVSIGPINNDINILNNTNTINQVTVSSFDPNDMIAEPSGMIPQNTTINYTIRFQNTGNAPAYNVFIYDTLDQNLDGQTFQFLGSTHPLTYHMDQTGLIKFSFYNIHLPDSGTDNAGSNGLLTYSIKVKDNLAPLTVINGKAGIVFDFNAPVITNTVADTIQLITNVTDYGLSNTNKWSIYPNPSNGNYIHFISDNLKQKCSVKFNTIDGKEILHYENIRCNETIDISSISAGVYLITIISDDKSQNIKLIKNK